MKRFRKTNVDSVPEIPLLADEDDYMSAIPGLEQEEKNTPKAIPISTLIEQFDRPSEDLGKRNKRRKMDELMSAVLGSGLRTSLIPSAESESKIVNDSDQKNGNVGWKLLQKFGYKLPTHIEKSESSQSGVLQLKGLGRNESGMTEPLDILPFTEQGKEGKTGLGMKQHEHRIAERRREKTREIEKRFFSLQQFFSFYAKRFKEHEKIVKVIYELDLRKNSQDNDDDEEKRERNDIIFSIEEAKALHQRYQHRLLPTSSKDNDEEQEERFQEDTAVSFPAPRDIYSKAEEDMR